MCWVTANDQEEQEKLPEPNNFDQVDEINGDLTALKDYLKISNAP